MNNPDYNLRPVWDAILDLYGRFDAFCKKHQLHYYVTGGTLLGAVRHNGFIPWDDDFDVVMPHPDYARFLELVRAYPIDNTVVRAKEFDTHYPHFFAKVVESRHDVVERVKNTSNLNLTDGINIDVIPIYGMPKSTIPFYYWALKRAAWRHRNEHSLIWRILWHLLWGWVKDAANPFSFQCWLASYGYDHAPAVEDYNGNGRRFKLRALTAKSFGDPVMHVFDRTVVPIPAEWDKFLHGIFGDYMKLPPVEQRKPSHQITE